MSVSGISENADDKINDKSENGVKGEKKKKVSCKEKKWTCDDKPLWRVFVNSYLEKEEKLEKEDKFDRRKAPVLSQFPNVKSSERILPSATYPYFPLDTFNLKYRARLPDRLNPREKIRIWRKMNNDTAAVVPSSSFSPEMLRKISQTNSEKWRCEMSPCVKINSTGELEQLEKLSDKRERNDYIDRKELGHARVPITCRSVKKSQPIDRAVGEHPGLVDGDYALLVFDSRNNDNGNRSYANVCLRGSKGMHLGELSFRRVRAKTWKFCFYQAIVALVAKTQIRYKFAWKLNIDYIFDDAWMLFVHMGGINVKEKIRLDDVVVYNYKYNVELELVSEIKDAPWVTGIYWNYVEDDFRRMEEVERPELMKTSEEIPWEKTYIRKVPAVHEVTRQIEEWFDQLPDMYQNCIFRTDKFSLAFWRDGTFWYLYNPYRCDEFGFWSENGYACIVKFSSRFSLKRHLMILMLRGYSYARNTPLKLDNRTDTNKKEYIEDEESETLMDDERSKNSQESKEESKVVLLAIQIYRMIYHRVKIHNIKLPERKPPDSRVQRENKKIIDDCGSDIFSPYDPCARHGISSIVANDEDEDANTMEKPDWLKRFKLTWKRNDNAEKVCWHQFYVEEPYKIFSLWGEIHPTEEIFAKENRGKQIYAVYVVCAGMTRIQAPEYWSPKTLDAIIMCGDRYYTLSQLQSDTLARNDEMIDVSGHRVNYLGKHIKIGETLFESDVLPAVCGTLYKRSGKYLWKTIQQIFLKHHFAILTCETSCLCVFKYCGAYYMMDAHSMGPPLFNYGDGVAYLIRATSFDKFITVLVLTIGSTECSRFSINPIEIRKVIDLGTSNVDDNENKRFTNFARVGCPSLEDEAKTSKKYKKRNTIDCRLSSKRTESAN